MHFYVLITLLTHKVQNHPAWGLKSNVFVPPHTR